MRSSSNYGQFPHVGKNPRQKEEYKERIHENRKPSETDAARSLSGDFDETEVTNEKSDRGQSLPLPIKDMKEPPYVSWQQWLRDHRTSMILGILGSVVLGLFGWIMLTLYNNSLKIASIEPVVEQVRGDVEDLQAKYDSLGGKTLSTEFILREIQKDLDNLQTRVIGGIKE